MKTKMTYALMIVVSLLTVARVDASTVFAPTDGDVNFLFGDLKGGTLAMFDDSDQSYQGNFITIDVPSIVNFSGPDNNGDHTATNNQNQSLTLTGNDNFILGLNFGGNWLVDSSVLSLGADSYMIMFNNGGSVLEIDVQIVPSAVPVPAAVWLMGSGLLGLIGFSRKNKALVAA